MAQISIIVPVYNAAAYLDACVESLVKQTYRDIEIILVDDGSKDASGAICDEWAAKDNRIIVIHKENGGVSATRAAGIRCATANYVGFLDSDDCFDSTYCEKMLYAIETENADLVECAYRHVHPNCIRDHHVWETSLQLSAEEFRHHVVRQTIVYGTEAVVLWNKLYKKQMIGQLVTDYGENVLEDYLFNMQYYRGVQRYVYLPECLVNYRQTAGSLSRRCNLETFTILKQVEVKKQQCLAEMGLDTATDRERSAQWFVEYSYRFLLMYLKTTDAHRDEVLAVLQDPVMAENCVRCARNFSFAQLVADGCVSAAYRQLRKHKQKDIVRHYLSRIKRILTR